MILSQSPVVQPPVRWHVAFMDVDPSTHWLRRWLGYLPEPRHVAAFRDCPGGVLIVEHTLSQLIVDVIPGETAAEKTAQIRFLGGLVVPVDVFPTDGWTPRLGNCVTTTRALLGMRPRIQTARGLFRQIVAR